MSQADIETRAARGMELTEEQELLRETVHRFAADEVAPRAAVNDRDAAWPEAAWQGMAELGLAGIAVPEELGGAAMDRRAVLLAYQELARGCASTAVALAGHLSLCASAIVTHGSLALKQRLVPGLADGSRIGGGALAVAELGIEGLDDVPTAVACADGYRLSGRLALVANATRAGVFVVPVRLAADETGLMVVERDMAGLEVGPAVVGLGLRAAGRGALVLSGCMVPADHLLGAVGAGAATRAALQAEVHLATAAVALGVAQAAFDRALRYGLERSTFGKPIARHQAISFKLADMSTRLEVARCVFDQAVRGAAASDIDGVGAALARLSATEAAEHVAFDAIQIHGGYGYAAEYEVERMWRDARTVAELEGSRDQQRQLIFDALMAGVNA